MYWMPEVSKNPTAAYGGYGNITPTAVVCHVIEGWKSTMNEWASQRPVINQASYHFVIGLNGQITQYVPINEAAWHAGRVDATSNPSVGVPWKQYRGTNPNGYTIGIGAEGFSATSWNEAQHDACASILTWLSEEYDMVFDEDSLIGHCDISPMTRGHDPGDNWDKVWLLGEVNAKTIPNKIKRNDIPSWIQAYLNGAIPIGFDGDDEIHQFKIPRRVLDV